MSINKDAVRLITQRASNDLARSLNETYELLNCQVLQVIDNLRTPRRVFVIEFDIAMLQTSGLLMENVNSKINDLIAVAATDMYLSVDNTLSVIQSNDLSLTASDIQSLSNHNAGKFYVYYHEANADTSYAYNIYYQGVSITETHIFNNPQDSFRYKVRLSMSNMEQVFVEYQSVLSSKNLNDCFFLRECDKNSQQKGIANLLRPSPEELFQKHFVSFIRENSSMEALSEVQMIDGKRCDVFLEERSKFIILEIKWMGQSAGNPNTKGNYSFKIDKIQEGLDQIFQYLSMGRHVVKSDFTGYLLIYDARQLKSNDTIIASEYIDSLTTNAEYLYVQTNYFRGVKQFQVDQ